MHADFKHIAADLVPRKDLVVGHEHESGVVLEPPFNAVESIQVGKQEALLHGSGGDHCHSNRPIAKSGISASWM
jgi:hypothetical protein